MPAPQAPGPDVRGLAFDAGGRLYAAEPRTDRVAVLGAANETLGLLGAGILEKPAGVAIAPGGDLLVTDEHGVRRLAPDGTTTAAWPAEDPDGIAAAADGTVYVSESDGVARFSGAGVRLGGFAADHPRGIAVAADGTVWVAVAGALAHVSAAGVPLGATPADHGEGVAVGPDGTVLVAERERDRVARVAPDGTPAGMVAGDFDEPRGVAVDCRGTIAVSDDSPARVHRIAAAGAPPPPCFAPAAAAQAAPSPEPERPIARRLTATPAPGLLPSLGRTALAATATGRVFVHLPGATDAVALAPGTLLPIGARIDARAGRVGLEFATRTADFDRFGTVQTGVFRSGIFVMSQRAGASLVELRLPGAAAGCGHAPRRRLWSAVHGRFRTRGTLATATATSARWLIEDRCGATLVRVTRGVVRVRDEVRHRTVRLRAGGRVVVRARR